MVNFALKIDTRTTELSCSGRAYYNVTLTAYYPVFDSDNEFDYLDARTRKLRNLQVCRRSGRARSVVLIFLTSMIFVVSLFVIWLSRTGSYPVIKGNDDIVTRFVIGLSGWSCRICDSLHGPGFRDTIRHKIVHSRIKRKILTANSASGIVL